MLDTADTRIRPSYGLLNRIKRQTILVVAYESNRRAAPASAAGGAVQDCPLMLLATKKNTLRTQTRRENSLMQRTRFAPKGALLWQAEVRRPTSIGSFRCIAATGVNR